MTLHKIDCSCSMCGSKDIQENYYMNNYEFICNRCGNFFNR